MKRKDRIKFRTHLNHHKTSNARNSGGLMVGLFFIMGSLISYWLLPYIPTIASYIWFGTIALCLLMIMSIKFGVASDDYWTNVHNQWDEQDDD